jgi:general secretion pathway protein G
MAVAILGILSSLAVPNYLDFIERAKVARSIAELHMIAGTVKGYAATSGQYPDTLAQAGQSALLDPWGNPYQYLRIDCGINIMVGHLTSPNAPAHRFSERVFPANTPLSLPRAQVSFAIGGGPSQNLIQLVAKGGNNSNSGSSSSSGSGSGGESGSGGAATCGSGKPRKDHFLHPVTSDFDLYSMGKDGATAAPLTAQISHDDVIRASDGAYYGLAKNF